MNCLEQGWCNHISVAICRLVTAQNSSRPASSSSAGLYVGVRITDHPRFSQLNVMFARCGQKHSWCGFAATARRPLFVRTRINRIDGRASRSQLVRHTLMYGIQLVDRDKALCHTPLVARHDYVEPGEVEQGDGFSSSWKKLHFFPASYVLAFGRFQINDSITIQKRAFYH